MVDIQKTRRVELVAFEKVTDGEYDLYFEDDWFVSGDKIYNQEKTVGFKIDYRFGITKRGYRAYPIKLTKEITNKDKYEVEPAF